MGTWLLALPQNLGGRSWIWVGDATLETQKEWNAWGWESASSGEVWLSLPDGNMPGCSKWDLSESLERFSGFQEPPLLVTMGLGRTSVCCVSLEGLGDLENEEPCRNQGRLMQGCGTGWG